MWGHGIGFARRCLRGHSKKNTLQFVGGYSAYNHTPQCAAGDINVSLFLKASGFEILLSLGQAVFKSLKLCLCIGIVG